MLNAACGVSDMDDNIGQAIQNVFLALYRNGKTPF
jgi:hypothetical protein